MVASIALLGGLVVQPSLVAISRRLEPARLACSPRAAADDDLDLWRVDRHRLDAAWSKSIRKRRPRWLPFVEARAWARASSFSEEEDWRRWVSDGEKRNSYVPSFPDEAYRDSGWAGWHDFLNGASDAELKPGFRRDEGPQR